MNEEEVYDPNRLSPKELSNLSKTLQKYKDLIRIEYSLKGQATQGTIRKFMEAWKLSKQMNSCNPNPYKK